MRKMVGRKLVRIVFVIRLVGQQGPEDRVPSDGVISGPFSRGTHGLQTIALKGVGHCAVGDLACDCQLGTRSVEAECIALIAPGHGMPEEKIAASAASVALRDEDGALRGDFVDRVAQAIVAGDAAALRTLLGDLHESDVGDLIQALDAELRPRLVSLMGADFDFSALTEVDSAVRVGILEELPAETVAAGVRNLDSDDAVAILVDLPQEK